MTQPTARPLSVDEIAEFQAEVVKIRARIAMREANETAQRAKSSTYRQRAKIVVRRYVPGEDMTHIKHATAPRVGDYIAWRAKAPQVRWLISPEMLKSEYEICE